MTRCPSCGGELPVDSRFCPACGSAVSFTETPTETFLGKGEGERQAGETGPAEASGTGLSSSAIDSGRFLAGTVLASRYRIIGLLGRGGMGEVYRAEDLKLGQAVALKFLPPEVEGHEERLRRFLNEVKVSLRVTHPNVCRVYDIGEVDGQHFISMEYVDGEDLASLLRRIGRLPRDKALEIAHQLCAGLAAAHDQGVLHRDLKPANVMIDGRGRARITDFGLASLSEVIPGAEAQAGTPAYMAPEQLAGQGASARSDLYALGLVLYELFTGRRAFAAGSVPELVRQQEESRPATPSSVVDGFDPVIEGVILACLEKEPARRPASALAVARALPGGDPLAAALAAGETPAPEVVAQASDVGGLEPRVAWVCLGALVVGLLMVFSGAPQITNWVELEKPPEVLRQDARDLLRQIGYDEPPRDSTSGFELNEGYLSHLEESDASPARWEPLAREQPPALLFWYRQSSRYLQPLNPAIVLRSPDDPPADISGMAHVELDPAGRLHRLEVVPPEKAKEEEPADEVDWGPVFAAAGLEEDQLTPVEPVWSPPVFATERRAWEGVYPEAPETAIRVEAASYRGRPVSFRIVEPWTEATPQEHPEEGPAAWVVRAVGAAFWILALAGGLLLAWRNLRLGRGDRKGAFRFALYLMTVRMGVWLFGMEDLLEPGWTDSFMSHLAWALWRFGLVWVFYLALEPYLRKLWPQTMVSWLRLLDRRWRDPLVGRDVLFGCLAFVAIMLLFKTGDEVAGWLGLPPFGVRPELSALEALRGFRHAISMMLFGHALILLQMGMFALVWLLLMRLLLRRTWLAAAVWSLTILVSVDPFSRSEWPALVAMLLLFLSWWLVVYFRFGLLPLAVALGLFGMSLAVTQSLDPANWYAGPTYLALFFILALGLWGLWVSLAGRPLLRDELAEA